MASTAVSHAQSEQAPAPGIVVVADASGKVEAVHPDHKSPRRLKTKDRITESHTVNVGEKSTATLVFSNGAIISLLEKSTMEIEKFLQDPFSTPFAMALATEEPTTSSTKLNLTKGEVVYDVKNLRTEKGSTLTVETPSGAAGVRGTVFAVTFTPNFDGTDKGIYILSVLEGEVAYTAKNGKVYNITAGLELVIYFRSEEDPLTGEIIILEILSEEIRQIPEERLEMIARVAAKGRADASTIIFEGTGMNLFYNQPPLDIVPFMESPPPMTPVNP